VELSFRPSKMQVVALGLLLVSLVNAQAGPIPTKGISTRTWRGRTQLLTDNLLPGDNGQVAGIFGGGMAKGGSGIKLTAPSGKPGPTTWASINLAWCFVSYFYHSNVIVAIVRT
jgi:hypothetical protein